MEEAEDTLKWIYPRDWDKEPFRRGYERGRAYWQGRQAAHSRPR